MAALVPVKRSVALNRLFKIYCKSKYARVYQGPALPPTNWRSSIKRKVWLTQRWRKLGQLGNNAWQAAEKLSRAKCDLDKLLAALLAPTAFLSQLQQSRVNWIMFAQITQNLWEASNFKSTFKTLQNTLVWSSGYHGCLVSERSCVRFQLPPH